ncbi:hypothetical protein C6499_19050 [Candidatus Poribacteria bacterium]|nr:MAG: hypothetical protein C6499_19050 [Candidatus Poribacteria bacterium]
MQELQGEVQVNRDLLVKSITHKFSATALKVALYLCFNDSDKIDFVKMRQTCDICRQSAYNALNTLVDARLINEFFVRKGFLYVERD